MSLIKYKVGDTWATAGLSVVVDSTPTQGSPNAIASGGVYNELSALDPNRVVKEAGGIPEYVETNGGKIDTIKVNGTAQTITDKVVDLKVATLDDAGKVPSSQLPSYVDDVLEYANREAFPNPGETGKIYVAIDTNKTYRWSGSAYIKIDDIVIDSTPTSGSTNAVSSGGVYSAIQEAEVVKYTSQTLTEEQKAQARTNIGVGTVGIDSTGPYIESL